MDHRQNNMILHIAIQEKFIPPFIEFLEEHFDDFPQRHFFYIEGDYSTHPVKPRRNILLASGNGRWGKCVALLRLMYRARKIMLHGLWGTRCMVIQLLAMQPWLLGKCYWIIWGGDLYRRSFRHRTIAWWASNLSRRIVIKRLGHLVSYLEGDIELARQWYGATGRYHECLMYPSNIFREYLAPVCPGGPINILIGNSADPSNEHFEIIETLAKHKGDDIRIFAPLSYGDREHALKVSKAGARIFGSKFTALLEFLSFDDYMKLLAQIDVAIFNHRRQQAMGNTITLLGLGRKVFMRKGVSQWRFLKGIGAVVFDVEDIDLSPIDPVVADANRECIRAYFSLGRLKSGLSALFE